MELADSGRVGVVQRISPAGEAVVALGSRDAEQRLHVPGGAELIHTVSPRAPIALWSCGFDLSVLTCGSINVGSMLADRSTAGTGVPQARSMCFVEGTSCLMESV